MKKIEELVREEQGAMDIHDPPDGHTKRFLEKLEKNMPEKELFFIGHPWISIAATIVFLFLGWWFFYLAGYTVLPGHQSLATYPAEFTETENYYSKAIEGKIEKLKALPIKDKKIRDGLMAELKELNQSDVIIKKDLQNDPGNELIVNALIEQYQKRLEILNNLIMRLTPQVNNLKSNSYENHHQAF